MSNHQDLVARVNSIAEELNLVSKAFEGAQLWINSDDFDLDNVIKSNLKLGFRFHKLCFKNERLDYPYIETQLDIYLNENDVGDYSLYSLLDGEAVDDALVITDDELKYN